MHGNAVGDTTYQFSTLNADTLSEISGQVVDLNSEGRGNLHVGARHLEDEGSVYSQVLPGPEAYRFRGVLPGQYVLDVFRDRDGNGRYSYGRPFPYEPAERFVVYEDTVAVRSRWPNEGNTIILR